jgi:hypothetical protein
VRAKLEQLQTEFVVLGQCERPNHHLEIVIGIAESDDL